MSLSLRIEQFENLFQNKNRSPNLRIDKERQLIFVRGTRVTSSLPVLPYDHKLFNVQKVLEHLKQDFEHSEGYQKYFPFGKETHRVSINFSTDQRLYGGGLLVFESDSECEELDRTPYSEPVPLGALLVENGKSGQIGPRIQRRFAEGLIKPGRLVTIRSKHGKFLVPKIVFPYGVNSFEEELGQFEEIDLDSTITETVIESDFIMDDFDD